MYKESVSMNMRDFILKADYDDIFCLFHSILYRINDNKKEEDKIIILDKDIRHAINKMQKTFKDLHYKQYLEAKQ
jgi:hypothetical protein